VPTNLPESDIVIAEEDLEASYRAMAGDEARERGRRSRRTKG